MLIIFLRRFYHDDNDDDDWKQPVHIDIIIGDLNEANLWLSIMMELSYICPFTSSILLQKSFLFLNITSKIREEGMLQARMSSWTRWCWHRGWCHVLLTVWRRCSSVSTLCWTIAHRSLKRSLDPLSVTWSLGDNSCVGHNFPALFSPSVFFCLHHTLHWIIAASRGARSHAMNKSNVVSLEWYI